MKNKTVSLQLTKNKYLTFLKLIYLGNWFVNAIRLEPDRVKQYDDVEQYVFSFAKTLGFEEYIGYDAEIEKFYPTDDFDRHPELIKYRREYEENSFWNELIFRLAHRDFIDTYGDKAIQKMDMFERMEKEHSFIHKYEQEFTKNSLKNLAIMDTNKN